MARITENNKNDIETVQMMPDMGSVGYADRRKKRKRAAARKRTDLLSRGYVLFLGIMCIVTVLMCIRYLRLKETITEQNKINQELRVDLKAAREENDALLESIENSVDMNHIREVAMNKFGMKYATEDQVIWYNGEDNGYVEQYRDVS
ncbi:MAG: hypothetical protein Q4A32_09010 [Lachnospiraceae bacterium]|nr:hypothetical protein [Lachnospiraceae bacterium]